jgi:NAD+ diphosphatase
MDLLVTGPADARRIPTLEEARGITEAQHFLGTLNGRDCYAGVPRPDLSLPSPFEWAPARSLYGMVDEPLFWVAGRAVSIAEWDLTHRFCGRCATPTELIPHERARRCPKDETHFYPRLSPAVIVLIQREDGHALLARGANFPRPWFSTLAGFVEPGESLEDTVRREVMEEVGVSLGEVRYFGSQPWPFGRSLMVGFTADWASGEIRIDPKEIAEARWFSPDDPPQIPPRLSIAHALITDWRTRMRGKV